MKYSFFFLLFLVGCAEKKVPLEDISYQEYEFYRGYNAALVQFGNEDTKLVDLSNKRVLKYASEETNETYADGYHRALRDMRGPVCPR